MSLRRGKFKARRWSKAEECFLGEKRIFFSLFFLPQFRGFQERHFHLRRGIKRLSFHILIAWEIVNRSLSFPPFSLTCCSQKCRGVRMEMLVEEGKGRGNIIWGKRFPSCYGFSVSISFPLCFYFTKTASGVQRWRIPLLLLSRFNFFSRALAREFPLTTNNWKMPSSLFSLKHFGDGFFFGVFFHFNFNVHFDEFRFYGLNSWDSGKLRQTK